MSVDDGVIIGAAGGAIAGLVLWLVNLLHQRGNEWTERRRIRSWLRSNTTDETGKRYRSTRAIASWTNLTEDRVRYLCSFDPQVYLSTGPQEDMWSLYQREDRSVYETRGVVSA